MNKLQILEVVIEGINHEVEPNTNPPLSNHRRWMRAVREWEEANVIELEKLVL